MTGNDVRAAFLRFMEERGHAIVPSAALVPENDPTTLFTGSGMQPLVPYLMGEVHPKGTRIADSQKCFRAEDIEEVGDNRHTTFFEMLGNWSLGDYFKAEQLPWFYSFLLDEVGLDPERIYVTVFAGDESAQVPRDTDAVAIWKKLFTERGVSNEVADMGTEAEGSARGMQSNERIFYYDASKNWWSRAGTPENMPVGEIGGPDSEVFYEFVDVTHDPAYGEHCHPNCDCGRFLEIGNSVFMEYVKTENGFEKLPKQNVDFGGGLERIAAAANNNADVFTVDLLHNVVTEIEKLSGTLYTDNTEAFRVITDHIRGAVFMIGDGVYPSNTDQGYFVRRLLRRSVRYADVLGITEGALKQLADSVIDTYKGHYKNLADMREEISMTIGREEEQFRKTIKNGLRELDKIAPQKHFKKTGTTLVEDRFSRTRRDDYEITNTISGEDAFILFTTHGFPIELTEEIAAERGFTVDRKGFDAKMKEHQETSRAGAEQKFKGGLADHSKKVVEYHSATHLLLAGLRKYLGDDVHQAGSNITGERLRFDFTYPEKVDADVLEKVEQYVNDAIAAGGSVTIETLPKEVAQEDSTIEASFWDRYPDEVKVYTMTAPDGTIFSRELCGGPHVPDLSEITGTFTIKKEESSAAGVRRIKAVLQ